jgi:hypothetical protein
MTARRPYTDIAAQQGAAVHTLGTYDLADRLDWYICPLSVRKGTEENMSNVTLNS